METKAKPKGPKMLQVNVMDPGQGKLTINIRRQGFSDPEVLGILEMAKSQVQNMMKANVGHGPKFGFKPGKGKD
jgi:hypothetical protein